MTLMFSIDFSNLAFGTRRSDMKEAYVKSSSLDSLRPIFRLVELRPLEKDYVLTLSLISS